MNLHAIQPPLDCTDIEAWAILAMHADYPNFLFRINPNPTGDDTRVQYRSSGRRHYGFVPLRESNAQYWTDRGRMAYPSIDYNVLLRIMDPEA